MVFVLSENQACIAGATVQVVGGQRLGESRVQDGSPCDRWDIGGGGVSFDNVEAGVAMTLRAAAPGYTSQEKTFIPKAVLEGPVEITLERTLPTYPDPPPLPPSLTVMALDGINCIAGTTIELIKARTVVERGTHDASCGPWDGLPVTFYKVTYGEEVTLRASAPGYQTQEMTVVVKENTPTQNGVVYFELRRI